MAPGERRVLEQLYRVGRAPGLRAEAPGRLGPADRLQERRRGSRERRVVVLVGQRAARRALRSRQRRAGRQEPGNSCRPRERRLITARLGASRRGERRRRLSISPIDYLRRAAGSRATNSRFARNARLRGGTVSGGRGAGGRLLLLLLLLLAGPILVLVSTPGDQLPQQHVVFSIMYKQAQRTGRPPREANKHTAHRTRGARSRSLRL